MSDNISINKNTLLYLGLYQLVGGSIGIALLYSATGLRHTLPVWLLIGIVVTGMIFSIIAGFACIKEKENALKLSLINQVVQLVGFSAMGFTFSLMCCPSLSVSFDLTRGLNLGIDFDISSSQISINPTSSSAAWMQINLVACFLIYYIEKLRKKLKEVIELAQADELGSKIN